MRKGYVYLIRQGQSDLYKIGHTTKKPENRLKELQTGNPEDLVLINYFQSKYFKDIETLMHTHNKKFHVIREWFRFDLSIETDFLSECQKKEPNAKFIHEQKKEQGIMNDFITRRVG